jgi:serine/threonine protein kinase
MADSGRFKSSKKTGPKRRVDVIGKGGYGCVVKPILECKDEDTNLKIRENERIGKKYVSKIFNDRDDLKETIEENILNNDLANRAGIEASGIAGVTADFGMESYYCELKAPITIPECGEVKLSRQSLILTDLGDIDADKMKELNIISNLIRLTYEEIERAVISNLINISKLHSIGYVDMDLKLGNIIPNNDSPFSFKLIDYDMFRKKDEELAFGYSHATYFFPPEYNVFGNFINGRFTSIDDIEKTKDELRHYYRTLIGTLTRGDLRIPKMAFFNYIGDNTTKWEEIFKNNAEQLIEIKKEYERMGIEAPKISELLTSVDYFMYALAIYAFIYELKKAKKEEDPKKWDELLEKISRFFHPNYSLRLEAIREFLDRGTL